jgi:putative acetyltransferase
MDVRLDDLSGPEIRALLEEHVSGLRAPDITFWTVWSGSVLLGCGALRELSPVHGEIKSMRTSSAHRRKGVARAMLAHIIDEATKRRYHRLSLETGSMQAFEPAQMLYETFGFTYCPPFGDYVEDPNSVFMTRVL